MAPYQRIAEDIRQKIRNGELRLDDRLPTQARLAAEFGVSLQPVKAAVMLLESEGWIKRREGGRAVVTR